MEEKKRIRTDADRKADRNYREKVKPIQFSIQYKKEDRADGIRLEKYIEILGVSKQAYIKDVIKRDLDSKGIPYPPDGMI